MIYISTVFLDWDDTLCDFRISERNAIYEALGSVGIYADEDMYRRYSQINESFWRRFEAGEISKPEIMRRRFEQFFAEFGYDIDPQRFNALYLEMLSRQVPLIPGAESLCRALSDRYAVYITTNGDDRGQRRRIAASGLSRYFRGIFTSEGVGAGKPDAKYWNYVFGHIGERDRSRMIVAGDSQASDIRSGTDMGMHTCWINLRGAARSSEPEFEARSLSQAEDILCGGSLIMPCV